VKELATGEKGQLTPYNVSPGAWFFIYLLFLCLASIAKDFGYFVS